MKIVRNRTGKPVKVPLGQGKVLHLGPGKTAQVSAHATESPALRKLVDDGTLEIVGEGTGQGAHVPEKGTPVHESTHGHPQPHVVVPKGNR